MTNTEATAAADILAADLDSHQPPRLLRHPLEPVQRQRPRVVWELIDSTQEGAIAYYAELADRDDDGIPPRRGRQALAGAGWTRKAIAFKLS